MTRNAAPRRRLLRDRRGNVALEFALTAPIVMMLLFGIIEFGRAMWLQNALDFAVAEAARCASINPTLCGTPSQIQGYAASQSGAGFDGSLFTVSTPSCGNQVSASYPMSFTIPFLPRLSVDLDSQACFPS